MADKINDMNQTVPLLTGMEDEDSHTTISSCSTTSNSSSVAEAAKHSYKGPGKGNLKKNC